MPYDRFLIGPFETGLQTNMRPWLIMDDAFEQLQNAYVFRGRVRKRFGSRFMGSGWTTSQTEPLFSRFRINLGNTNGSGNISVTVPGDIFATGQQFSVGNEIFTVYQTGTPAAMLAVGGVSVVHTYNTSTGAVVISGAALTTPLYFYPAQPAMGLTNYEKGPVNDQPSYGFDTQFVYVFSGGSWSRSGTAVWHGNNLNFFWTTNYRGSTGNVLAMFTTNFQVTNYNGAGTATDDPIWYTQDGNTWVPASGSTGFYFLPAGGAPQTGPFVQTALIIVGFKNRLLLLNTVENNNGGGFGTNSNYINRCRYSFNGSPFAVNAWYEPNQTDSSGNVGAGAGFIDATTSEAIVSAEFIKDRLIVYFQESTWEIVYTGNAILPFVWQKINTELGSEATFSTVPFDKQLLTIGNTGVHACNGANVERIDTKIPDQIFQIVDKNLGVERVAGIRDYYTEMVYWTFPSIEQNSNEVYPSQVLVYNYRNSSWAFNNDCITAWGYFEQQTGETWASTTLTWEQANQTWASGTVEAQFRQVIAGNQQGYVFIIDTTESKNAQAMQITNMQVSGSFTQLTIIDHTLNVTPYGDYINLLNTGVGIDGIYKVTSFIDTDNVLIGPITFVGTYVGGGSAARVSNIQILTKQWNPYVDKSKNVFIAKIDFGVQKTSSGQITVDYYPSATELSMINEGTGTGSIQGTSVLETFPYLPTYYPLEQYQDRLWHPVYFQSDGECIQLFMYMTQAQITNPAIAFSDFEIEGMVLHTQTTTARLQ
jgi:hypothetical protein